MRQWSLSSQLAKSNQWNEHPSVHHWGPGLSTDIMVDQAFFRLWQATEKQQGFNYCVSHACCVVKNAFGRLKGRWRSLMKRNDTDIRFLPTLATACCVLHNICEIHGDDFNNEWLATEAEASGPQAVATAVSVPSGDRIRAALCDYFETM